MASEPVDVKPDLRKLQEAQLSGSESVKSTKSDKKAKSSSQNNNSNKKKDKMEDDEIEPEEYVVEKIVEAKYVNGTPYYLVKWKGWSDESNTWEPYANVRGCAALAEFRKSVKKEEIPKEKLSRIEILQELLDEEMDPAKKESILKEIERLKKRRSQTSAKRNRNPTGFPSPKKKKKRTRDTSRLGDSGSLDESSIQFDDCDEVSNSPGLENMNLDDSSLPAAEESVNKTPAPKNIAQTNPKNDLIASESAEEFACCRTGACIDDPDKVWKVVGCRRNEDRLEVGVRVSQYGQRLIHWIENNIANEKIPQLVIKYYECRLRWRDEGPRKYPDFIKNRFTR